MSLAQVHLDASRGDSAGARAAMFVKGMASRIQNEINNQDFAAIRELCVQAAQMADDVALTVEHGGERAEQIRQSRREGAELSGARTSTQVAPSVDTPRVPPTPHAGPTDMQRAPTPETTGTVPAQPVTGERAQSAPKGDGPGPATATAKEQTGTAAGARTDEDKPTPAPSAKK